MHTRRRGTVIIYTVAAMMVLAGIISLAVDLGRVQHLRVELKSAADAMALAAASELNNNRSSAQVVATQLATANVVEGAAAPFDSSQDIEFGTWDADTKTFTAVPEGGSTRPTTVRVMLRRTGARGNPVRLTFASLLGISTTDVSVQSIATVAIRRNGHYPIVGLDLIESESNSTSTIDSYDSDNGAYSSGTAKSGAILASNGNIKLTSKTTIKGQARPGSGKSVSGSPSISGGSSALTEPLDYPIPNAGTAVTQNNNSSIPGGFLSNGVLKVSANQTCTLPGGVYYLNKLKVRSGGTLNFSGPVTIYTTRRVDIDGRVLTSGNIPANFKLVSVAASGTEPWDSSDSDDDEKNDLTEIEIESAGNIYCDLYAPQCEVDIEDNAIFHGYMVGKTLEISDKCAVHYDEASGSPTGGVGRGWLVK